MTRNVEKCSFTISRDLTSNEILSLKTALMEDIPDTSQIDLGTSENFGMSEAEIILNIAISFGSSIAANMAYDATKLVLRHLKSIGVSGKPHDGE